MDMLNTKTKTREQAVFEIMADGKWHTLAEIASRTGFGEASISAQLRDYRKPHYGGFKVWKRFVDGTRPFIYEYRLDA